MHEVLDAEGSCGGRGAGGGGLVRKRKGIDLDELESSLGHHLVYIVVECLLAPRPAESGRPCRVFLTRGGRQTDSCVGRRPPVWVWKGRTNLARWMRGFDRSQGREIGRVRR